ncbi:MBL fold metallo-hydrolase [Streptomyces indicus]|uniref:Glyoxylase, beta-lactamase superfamily II n=1 Tax=Streptomyces indicus TaxID=417292 RepID=A0A1G8T7T3_9ACTN|nr:MBL fold metallo-hydrolase [Streptomyces indicus]SDJ36740.1 Glyoxylase, beta-lactamase superfamily II [Streptomyces indicus]
MLTRVAEGVQVHRSPLLRNNSVVVQGASGVLLVDAGITGAEMACLAEDLRAAGQRVVAGFSTHPDWDHVLWHPAFGQVPRYGTAGCAAFLDTFLSQADWQDRVAEGLPPEIAGETPLDGYGQITGLPEGATHVPWDGPRVRVVEHPAHSPGHAALVVEDSAVLIAGDMLSDLFVPMLDDSDDPVEEYLAGLRLVEEAAHGTTVVVPGHGSVAEGTDRIRTRIAQDRAYLHALRDGREPEGDPRLGASVEPGWEWVNSIHEGQVETLARKNK